MHLYTSVLNDLGFMSLSNTDKELTDCVLSRSTVASTSQICLPSEKTDGRVVIDI